jgi:preprotein translocase subunit YajC
MLISPAYAQAASPGGGDFFVSLLPLVLIFAVFYFLLIRPQQRKVKEHRALVDNLKRGDQVLTSGGIFGKITKVEDHTVNVEIAKDVNVQVQRSTIADIVNKPKPGTAAPAAGTGAANTNTGGGFMGKLFKK